VLPLTPDRFTIERPTGVAGDADEVATGTTTVAAGVPCAFTSPGGSDVVANGRQELVDAVLVFPATPTVEHLDFAVDDRTAERYRVVWARRRSGLGLDHQRIGLAAVTGAAGG
jgi:hypothetical protein